MISCNFSEVGEILKHKRTFPTALSSCDPDWVAFQGSCYKLTPNPPHIYMSILESRWECLRIGADLVKIKTEEEHVFLKGILAAEKVCIYNHFINALIIYQSQKPVTLMLVLVIV